MNFDDQSQFGALCRRVASAFAVLYAGLAAASLGAEPPASALPSAESFFQRPAALEVKLSPSGRQLAISTGHGLKHIGLAVINLEGEPKAQWVAGFADADITHFAWVNEDFLVFSVVDLNEGSAEDYRIAPGLYSAKADGTRLRQLVRRRSMPFVSDGTQPKEVLDWNHMLLATLSTSSDEVVIGRLDFGDRAVSHVLPLWLNVRTGRTRTMALNGAPNHVIEWLFDRTGAPRVALTQKDGKEAVHWLNAGAAQWQKLAEAPLGELAFTPVGLDGDDHLYVTRAAGAGLWQAMTQYEFDKGGPSTSDLISAPGFDVDPTLLMDDERSRLLGARLEADAETTVWYDPAMKAIQKRVDELLPAWVNRLECRRCNAADRVVLVRSFSPQDPGRLWLFHPEREGTKALQPVIVLLPGIKLLDMGAKELVHVTARDGLDLPVWLTYPARHQPKGKPLPAVVLVHGGPWVRGGHWEWDPMAQFLASRGYVIIEPEFRGSAGYGLRHERAGFRQFGQAMQTDVADALQWAQQQGLASDKACIMGASYGGYAVLMGLARDAQLYRCGVEWVGLADLDLFLSGSWWVWDDISDSGRQVYLPERVGKLPDDAEMIHANNPIQLAERIKAPLLMAYGDGDRRVPIAHGKRMLEALRKAGNNPEWLVYEGEGHGWRTVEHQVDFARRVEKFLARYLLQAAPREGDTLGDVSEVGLTVQGKPAR